MSRILIFAMIASLSALSSCQSQQKVSDPSSTHLSPATAASAPATQKTDLNETDWNQVWQVLGRKGELHGKVYAVTVPRDDLMVNVEGMPIPTDAGLASVFHLWICPCGKVVMMGEFCLPDYEVNDVIDALRAGQVYVTSVSDMLLSEHPRLMSVRFYAEGTALEMAKTLKSALDRTGDARTQKQPMQ